MYLLSALAVSVMFVVGLYTLHVCVCVCVCVCVSVAIAG